MMLLRGRRGRVTVWAVSLAVFVAACQVPAPGGSAVDIVFGDGDPGRIVLAAREEGGYVLERWDAKRVAAPVLFADGRLLFPDRAGSGDTVYSRVRETVLDEWAMEAVATLILEVGFPDIGSAVTRLDDGIADASWWVITYFDAAGEHTIRTGGPEVTGEDLDGDAIRDLLGLLGDPLGSGPEEEFQPDSLLVYAAPAHPGLVSTRVLQGWPLPVPFAEMAAAGRWRCGVFDPSVATGFRNQPEGTVWMDGQEPFTIVVRPLMPGEEPCRPVVGEY